MGVSRSWDSSVRPDSRRRGARRRRVSSLVALDPLGGLAEVAAHLVFVWDGARLVDEQQRAVLLAHRAGLLADARAHRLLDVDDAGAGLKLERRSLRPELIAHPLEAVHLGLN